jgi:hypothetical protein
MRKFHLLLLMLVFMSLNTGELKAVGESTSLGIISHSFPLKIVFVGFQSECVDLALLDSSIGKNYTFNDGIYTFNYVFDVSYHFANSSYHLALKSFILANSVNGTDTTSKLNVTALEVQKFTGTRESIFLPQSGRAVNAVAVESWLVANPPVESLDASYWFYVLNLTELDSPDHSLEHWYNTTELDFDANASRDFWRLEWDNQLNPKVRFPYACFTSESRVFFIDPSAHQWYLTWARVWWGLDVSGPKYDYYFEDLDEFLRTHDVTTSEGKTELTSYLAGWIDDAVINLLAPDLWTNVSLSRAQSISLQTLVLNNASESGYSNQVMSWIVNCSLAEESIEDLAPFLDVKAEARFHNLSDYPQLEAIFDDSVLEKRDGWTYYDGSEVWNNLYSARDVYFNLTAADIVINSYVFLETNMSMMYAGGEYTGLGGGGQILVMKEVGRYFQADETSPKSGLTSVLVHEAGHNLGFPHTFVHGRTYAGDFAFDIMGYYPYSYFFTQFRKDCFQRSVVDYRTVTLNNLYDQALNLYERKNSTPIMDAEFDLVQARITEAIGLYESLHFLEAYTRIVEAEALQTNLERLIWIYLADLTNDGTVDIFDIVKVAIAYGSQPGDHNWNPNADLIQDSKVDIYDIVKAAANYYQKWK